jgi:hypothetical protein
MTSFFIPLLAPENQEIYDTEKFYNSTLAILSGLGLAALFMRLLPPLPAAVRTRRFLALTLRDLRRLAADTVPQAPDDWQRRVYGRLSTLPETAQPLQRAWLLAALLVGTEITRLRRIAGRFGLRSDLDAALAAVARGDSIGAAAQLAQLEAALAALPCAPPGSSAPLRARAAILAMSEVLVRHAAYFDGKASE